MAEIKDRRDLHASLIEEGVLSISKADIPSVADKGNVASIAIAKALITELGGTEPRDKLRGQKAGDIFEWRVRDYVSYIFPRLSAVRCGDFSIEKNKAVSAFDQYSHLAKIVHLANSAGSIQDRRELRIAFGLDYIIKPDIVISRAPVDLADLGDDLAVGAASFASRSSLLATNGSLPTLHASVSCKLTLRSDRAQNARSEALNLIRNRKGRLPHIALVTAEPVASRISSLALGTGDIDCVYHVALPELRRATEGYAKTAKGRASKPAGDGYELLETMIEGRRLRDVADLPFDLAV